MGKRYLRVIALACLGILAVLALQGSPQIAQVLSPMDPAHNSVYAVQAFYKAVERGDWLAARALTTREYWSQLEANGQITAWQDWRKENENLQFTGFSLRQSSQKQNSVIINGRPEFISVQGTVPCSDETITLVQGLGGWYISSIETEAAAKSTGTQTVNPVN